MLYRAKIKVTTAFIGDKAGRDGVYRFERNANKDIVIGRDVWGWAVDEALLSLQFSGVCRKTMFPDLAIRPPSIGAWVRKVQGNGRTGVRHEALNPGTVFTLDIMLASPSESTGRAPDKDELRSVLVLVGKYLGLSPWGRTHGFGHFDLISLEQCHPQP